MKVRTLKELSDSRRAAGSLRTSLALIALLGAEVFVSQAMAADDGPHIFVIDMNRVANESIIGKAARSNIEAEVRKSESKVALQRQNIEQLGADIQKQSSLLSADALEEKREVLAKRQREVERMMQDQREELGKKHNLEMKKVVDEIDVVVKQLSDRGTYPVIIEKDPRVVVYAADRTDLTSEVIRLLDAKKM
jgi:outer membrane protein